VRSSSQRVFTDHCTTARLSSAAVRDGAVTAAVDLGVMFCGCSNRRPTAARCPERAEVGNPLRRAAAGGCWWRNPSGHPHLAHQFERGEGWRGRRGDGWRPGAALGRVEIGSNLRGGGQAAPWRSRSRSPSRKQRTSAEWRPGSRQVLGEAFTGGVVVPARRGPASAPLEGGAGPPRSAWQTSQKSSVEDECP